MSDKPIYYLLDNYISPCLCFIHPNIITILGGILAIFLCINIIFEKSLVIAIILAFFIQLLDNLDGSVARKCNLQSKFGAQLDQTVDILKSVSITICFLIVMFRFKLNYIHYIVITIFIIILVYYLIMMFVPKAENSFTNFIVKFSYDNSIIIFMSYVIIIKLILLNFRKKHK